MTTAPRPSDTARLAPALAAALALGLAVAAGAQEAGEADVRTALIRELTARTEDPDPQIRGEAALALSTVAGPAAAGPIQAVATDRHSSARIRGLIALGRLGAAGGELVLGRALEESDPEEPTRHAAAFGLGLLPVDHLAPAVDAYLGRIAGASPTLERDTLVSLLANWTAIAQPLRAAALRAILEDDSVRDGAVRAVAFRALTQHDRGAVDIERAAAMLGAETAAERLAALAWLDAGGPRLEPRVVEPVVRLAARDRDPRVRAAACELLLHVRSPAALEVAAVLLDEDEPVANGAAVRTLLQLGGGSWRERVAKRIGEVRSAEVRVAALDAWSGPVPVPLQDALVGWLAARRRSADEKLAAALLLTREERDEAAVEYLRAVVVATSDAERLATVVDALAVVDPDLPCLDGFRSWRPVDADHLAARVAVLARHRPTTAESLLTAALQDARLDDRHVAAALARFRAAGMPRLAPSCVDTLPSRLRAVVSADGSR